MKPGDLVRNKSSESGILGLFIGMRTFVNKHPIQDHRVDYVCAEVMWADNPFGNVISTIQTNLLEVISESR